MEPKLRQDETGDINGENFSDIATITEDLDALLSLDNDNPSAHRVLDDVAALLALDELQLPDDESSPLRSPTTSLRASPPPTAISPTLSAIMSRSLSSPLTESVISLNLSMVLSPTTLLNNLLETSTPQVHDDDGGGGGTIRDYSHGMEHLLYDSIAVPPLPLTAAGVATEDMDAMLATSFTSPSLEENPTLTTTRDSITEVNVQPQTHVDVVPELSIARDETVPEPVSQSQATDPVHEVSSSVLPTALSAAENSQPLLPDRQIAQTPSLERTILAVEATLRDDAFPGISPKHDEDQPATAAVTTTLVPCASPPTFDAMDIPHEAGTPPLSNKSDGSAAVNDPATVSEEIISTPQLPDFSPDVPSRRGDESLPLDRPTKDDVATTRTLTEHLPDVLSHIAMNGPSQPSSSMKLDESALFSSPNKYVLDASFFDAASIADQTIVASPNQSIFEHWNNSAPGSDVASSDDEGLLSFVTAVEQHDADEMTLSSKETTATLTRVDETIRTVPEPGPLLPAPVDSVDEDDPLSACDTTTPKRSGRELQILLNADTDNPDAILQHLTTPDIMGRSVKRSEADSGDNVDTMPTGDGMPAGKCELAAMSEATPTDVTAPDSEQVEETGQILRSLEVQSIAAEPNVAYSLEPILETSVTTVSSASLALNGPCDPAMVEETKEAIISASESELASLETVACASGMIGALNDAQGLAGPSEDTYQGLVGHGSSLLGSSVAMIDHEVNRLSPAEEIKHPPPPPPANDHDGEEGHVVVSPLSSKNYIGSSLTKEDVRSQGRLKALQVEFPSALEAGQKRSDVSLSSASSTISHGSFTKGLASSGIVSPLNAEELLQRRSSSGGSLPPRFPEKGKELSSAQVAFADSLMKKLNVEDNANDENERVETKWIKQSQPASFNPLKSIFAGKSDTAKGPEISPPGSPPEPCYSISDDWDSSHGGDSCGASSHMPMLNMELGAWDMIIQDDNSSLKSSSNAGPEGMESAAAIGVTPLFKQTLKQKSSFSSSSHSSSVLKRRGVRDLLSVKGGSDHREGSIFLSRRRDAISGQPKGRAVSSVKSDGNTSMLALSEHASCTRHEHPDISRGHQSSPDLRRFIQSHDDPLTPGLESDGVLLVRPTDAVRTLFADAPPSINLSPEALADRFARQNEKSAEQEHRGALLEEELLAFSSMRRIDLPFRATRPNETLNYIGSARWRQLMSCWKHSEMTRVLMARPIAPVPLQDISTRAEMYNGYGGSSRYVGGVSLDDVKLNGVSIKEYQVFVSIKDSKTFRVPDREFNLPPITRFLTDLGGWPSATSTRQLRHELEGSSGADMSNLLDAAQSKISVLTSLVQDIASFASLNSQRVSVAESISFSVGLKDAKAIERKARLKYNGDILLVKDVLRAQVTCVNEGELVCALVYLLNLAGRQDDDQGNEDNASKFDVIRVKNLFCNKSGITEPPISPLPTGYRHLLLNLRMKGGLLAGK
jgi:hypothetical protein